jgi:uncharacterized protein (TIGR02145 family)
MRKYLLLTAAMFLMAWIVKAQNSMFIMKNGITVAKYNVETEIDSIIFYLPNTNPDEVVTDADGNVYATVTIDTQTWMAENLKTTKYNDGTTIPLVPNFSNWESLTTPGYCWYKNEPRYGDFYGAIYNWYTVNTGKLCPSGWHVPTQAEWETLIDYLGGTSVAGGKLKQTFVLHWNDPNVGATNEFGFTALPGGYRNTFASADYQGVRAVSRFWTATETDSDRAQFISISNDKITASIVSLLKNNGHSVRCIKD